MTMHKPADQITAALNAGSILPEAYIDRILGTTRLGGGDVRFVRPGEAAPKQGPYLHLRLPVGGRNGGTWYICDNTSPFERDVLGHDPRRHRRSTGFVEGEERQAADSLVLYAEIKRNALLGAVLPTQVSVATILRAYLHFLDGPGHNLSKSTVHSYKQYLVPLTMFFGGSRLGAIDAAKCGAYQAWRLSQDAAPNGYVPRVPRKISPKTVACEVVLLKRTINVYKLTARLNLAMDIPIPRFSKPSVTWLVRGEAARYLWAMRGRIWNAEASRWRVTRDDDPSLTGPEGDLRVLRPRKVREHRRRIARIFLLGIYTGGRHTSLLQGTYAEADRASVDWVRGALDRRASHEQDNNKLRPSVLLAPKLARWIRNWARHDRAKGITHMIHRIDGEAYARRLASKHWRQIDADAGVGKHVTVHALRHTCAMWLKGEGVSIWAAANFLGCSIKVLENHYGTWDMHSQVEAVAALSRMGKHRAAQILLRDMQTR